MKSEAVLCKPDLDGSIMKWTCQGLKEDINWVGDNVTIGVYLNNELIAGIIINEIRPNVDAYMTIYSINKRWCTRKVLRYVFNFLFDKVGCRRVSLLVSKDNEASNKLVKGLGFVCEGLLRQYRDDGKDCYFYGMLKSECKWRSK